MKYGKLDSIIHNSANTRILDIVTDFVYFDGPSGEMSQADYTMLKNTEVITIKTFSNWMEIRVRAKG